MIGLLQKIYEMSGILTKPREFNENVFFVVIWKSVSMTSFECRVINLMLNPFNYFTTSFVSNPSKEERILIFCSIEKLNRDLLNTPVLREKIIWCRSFVSFCRAVLILEWQKRGHKNKYQNFYSYYNFMFIYSISKMIRLFDEFLLFFRNNPWT